MKELLETPLLENCHQFVVALDPEGGSPRFLLPDGSFGTQFEDPKTFKTASGAYKAVRRLSLEDPGIAQDLVVLDLDDYTYIIHPSSI